MVHRVELRQRKHCMSREYIASLPGMPKARAKTIPLSKWAVAKDSGVVTRTVLLGQGVVVSICASNRYVVLLTVSLELEYGRQI